MKHLSSIAKILTGISLLLLSFSCKKSNDANNNNNNNTTGYYIKFKVDGVQKNFSSGTQATLTNNSVGSNGLYQAVLIAFKDVTGVAVINNITIDITTTTPIKTNKVYADNSQYGLTPEVIFIYDNEVGSDYYSINPDLVPNTSVNITLSQLTSTNMKGTFSGKVYGTSSSDFHVISEGEFNLPVK